VGRVVDRAEQIRADEAAGVPHRVDQRESR
jgi:hypothetical protein